MAYDLRFKPSPQEPRRPPRELDHDAQIRLAQTLLEEQNLVAAILAGLAGALAGAFAWGAVALGTGAIVAVVAIGVGVLVGFGVRVFGRGVTDIFAVVAALLAVFGCAVGNLLALILFELSALDISISQAATLLEPDRILADFASTLGLMEIFYWLIAAYSAWWLARRGLSKEEDQALDTWTRSGRTETA